MNDPFKPTAAGGDFTVANAGMHGAVLVAIVDEGRQHNPTFNTVAQKVSLGFEIKQDDEALIVWKQYTNSIGPKANLRKDLEAWRGAPFTKEEADAFTLKNVLGRSCQIQIMHKPSKDGTKTFANINAVFPKQEDLTSETEPFVFTVQNPQDNYDKLPKFIQNRVDNVGVDAGDYPAGAPAAEAAQPQAKSEAKKLDF